MELSQPSPGMPQRTRIVPGCRGENLSSLDTRHSTPESQPANYCAFPGAAARSWASRARTSIKIFPSRFCPSPL